jgi:hypothetical protein
MTTPKITTLLTLALVATFAGTMISAPQMISSAYAQGTPNPVPACPDNYPKGPGPGGICIDGKPNVCPKPLQGAATVVNGKCTDGPPKCLKYDPKTKKCVVEKCVDPKYPYLDPKTKKCQDGPPKCPAPIGGPGPGSNREPEVQNGYCVVKPGRGPPT